MWLAVVAGAWALDIGVRAEVDPDLRELRGVLTYTLGEGEPEPTWIDPLTQLPAPADDRTRLRTFPGPPDEGSVHWTQDGSTLTFTTRLPARNGDVGWTRRHGLRANGGWLPTPVDDAGRPRVVHWTAEVHATGVGDGGGPAPLRNATPGGDRARTKTRLLVLNGSVQEADATGGVHWDGRADRLALAVVPMRQGDTPHVFGSIATDWGTCVHVLGDHSRRRASAIEDAFFGADASRLGLSAAATVVIGPDDGRLVHVGPGVVYLSERAFRVWPRGLRRWHAPAVRAAIVGAACSACETGSARALLGRLRAGESHLASRRGLRPKGVGKLVDMTMQEPAIPAWPDMYDRPWLRAPDLYETLEGGPPAETLALRLDALEGGRYDADGVYAKGIPNARVRIAEALTGGTSPRSALAGVGIPDPVLDAWFGVETPTRPADDVATRMETRDPGPPTGVRGPVGLAPGEALRRGREPPPPQESEDIELAVNATQGGALVTRSAARSPDIVPVVVDGHAAAWVTAPPGDGSAEMLALPGATRVEVDPGGATRDVERGDNRLPRRWSTRPYGGIYALNLSERTFDAGVFLVVRHRGDTRHTWYLAGAHDAQDVASLQVGHGFGFGRLVRPRARSWRMNVLGGATLLDPSFDAQGRLPTGAVSLDTELSLTRDTLEDAFFPLEGTRVTLDAQGGYVTVEDATWTRIATTAVGILAPHPRHALAGRVRAGKAFGDVANRLLPLGGANDVRGLGESAWLCNERASASLEYRLRVLGNGAVPLGLGWLTEVHLSPGVDLGVGRRERATAAVLGLAGGLHGTVDLLGLLPVSGGISVGWPIVAHGLEASGAQLYLDAAHPF